jgi:hypothetical protein
MPVATIFTEETTKMHELTKPSGPAHLKSGMEFLVVLNMETPRR